MDTPVAQNGDAISLSQRQLIAFMRAVLREPELLILDEATANIDTVTEKMLARSRAVAQDHGQGRSRIGSIPSRTRT